MPDNSNRVNALAATACMDLEGLTAAGARSLLALSKDPWLRAALESPDSVVGWAGACCIAHKRLGQWPFCMGWVIPARGKARCVYLTRMQNKIDDPGSVWGWVCRSHIPPEKVPAAKHAMDKVKEAPMSRGKRRPGPWHGTWTETRPRTRGVKLSTKRRKSKKSK